MLYLFEGNDVEKIRTKAFAWIAAARAKRPDAPYVRLGADAITAAALEEVVQSQGLFFSQMLVLIDDPFSLTAAGDVVLEALPQLIASQNPIGIIAPKLLATRAKKLKAGAEKVFTVDVAEKKPARGFNSGLVNALAARDRVGLWKEIIRAKRAGDVPEMLHGLLHWKARDLMQKGGRGWTVGEARELSMKLIELLSDSRSGDLPLEMALERFALSM